MDPLIFEAARSAFPSNYDDARARFLALASTAKYYAAPARGPAGQPLYTDVAYIGDTSAESLLIVVSASHGVEGYCGSAAQADFLRHFASGLTSNTGALLVHAINPYGFAWDRRVTEEGCDLNRNFVDFAQPLPHNPGYDELADVLVPPMLDGPEFDAAEARIAAYRQLHGEHAFQVARKSGQYRYANGMFFGGFEATAARRTLETIAADYHVGNRKCVVIIDYHTGLGPLGYGELQCEQASGLDGYHRAKSAFGDSVTSPDLGTSSSVVVNGTADEFWERLLGDRHIYVCLEFGTYDPESGRRVLRQDHWLATYRPSEIDTELGRRIRTESRNHYSPQSNDWKAMIISRAREVTQQALVQLERGWAPEGHRPVGP